MSGAWGRKARPREQLRRQARVVRRTAIGRTFAGRRAPVRSAFAGPSRPARPRRRRTARGGLIGASCSRRGRTIVRARPRDQDRDAASSEGAGVAHPLARPTRPTCQQVRPVCRRPAEQSSGPAGGRPRARGADAAVEGLQHLLRGRCPPVSCAQAKNAGSFPRGRGSISAPMTLGELRAEGFREPAA